MLQEQTKYVLIKLIAIHYAFVLQMFRINLNVGESILHVQNISTKTTMKFTTEYLMSDINNPDSFFLARHKYW